MLKLITPTPRVLEIRRAVRTDSLADIMSIDRTPNPEAVHVRGRGSIGAVCRPTFFLYFCRLSRRKVPQLLSRVKAGQLSGSMTCRRNAGRSASRSRQARTAASARALDAGDLEPAVRGGADRDIAHRERLPRDERLRGEVRVQQLHGPIRFDRVAGDGGGVALGGRRAVQTPGTRSTRAGPASTTASPSSAPRAPASRASADTAPPWSVLAGEIAHDRVRFPEAERAVDEQRHSAVRIQREVPRLIVLAELESRIDALVAVRRAPRGTTAPSGRSRNSCGRRSSAWPTLRDFVCRRPAWQAPVAS